MRCPSGLAGWGIDLERTRRKDPVLREVSVRQADSIVQLRFVDLRPGHSVTQAGRVRRMLKSAMRS